MNREMVHRLIPADDLHWNEEEEKRILLSNEEIRKLVEACVKCGLSDGVDGTDEEGTNRIMSVIRWAEQIKSGNILLNGLLAGRLGVATDESNSEPIFFSMEELEEIKPNEN